MAGFGFGGFIKPQATNVRPGDVPTFRDLNLQDKLMMLGATLRGDMQGAQSIPMLAAARVRQAQQQGLEQEFARYLSGEGVPTLKKTDRPAIVDEPEPQGDATGAAARSVIAGLGDIADVPMTRDRVSVDVPTFEVERGANRKGPPNLRDALPLLIKKRQAGMDIKPDVELLKEVGPSIKFERGVGYDERDPSNVGREIFDVDKGQRRVYDETGRPIGVMNVNGYVQSVADLERAKTEATEGAKAAYDVGKYDLPDGSTVQMTRRRAVEALDPSIPRLGGGAPQAASAPAGFGRSQSPADQKLATGRADAQVERETAAPKAYSGLEAQSRTTDLVLEKLERALSLAGDGIGGGTGLNELTKFIPGTTSRDLDATLDTIRSAVGFDKLQEMRANSPTGGALGAISDKENKLLQSVFGSMDQGQSTEQFVSNLKRLRDELKVVRDERRRAFGRQYSDASPTAGTAGRAGAPSITADQARAELARRRAARGMQ